jgi:steroid 5-alpha reductase family enzyme
MLWHLGLAALFLSLAMALAWVVQHRTRNAGWVDAIWSLGTGLAGAGLALMPTDRPPGDRPFVVAAVCAIWSLRLALHIAERSRHGPEDARYAELRRDWGTAFEGRLFLFLQIQAAAAFLLALSVFIAALNPAPFGPRDLAALGVILVAVAGEAAADRQLRRWRRDPANHGGICESGLWRWSRHPNYFFEWLGWLAYPLFAIDPGGFYPLGWAALVAPGAMYFLLVHVSGIPPLERLMLGSRGDAFRDYQRRTRPFVPLPRSLP